MTHVFHPLENTTLSGTSVRECDASPSVREGERLGALALVLTRYDSHCYGQPFAHTDYAVERGQLTFSDGRALQAYRVCPHQTDAKNWKASDVDVYLELSQGERVMRLNEESEFELAAASSGRAPDIDGFYNTGVQASALSEPVLLLVLPAITTTAAPEETTAREVQARG